MPNTPPDKVNISVCVKSRPKAKALGTEKKNLTVLKRKTFRYLKKRIESISIIKIKNKRADKINTSRAMYSIFFGLALSISKFAITQ